MPRVKIDGPAPKERILTQARRLFFEQGYDPVSTDMIAKAARVSKSTLYNHFGNKKDILIATVIKETERFVDPDFIIPENFDDYRRAFINFGVNLLELLNEKDIQHIDQVMLSQAMSNPDISISFFEASYEVSYRHMSEMIRVGQEKKYIQRPEAPEFLAEILCHAWSGKPYHKSLYGFEDSLHERPKDRIESILQIILGI